MPPRGRAMETQCWLLGGEFEDSVFEERPERRPGPPATYRAKLCEPQWFYGETESGNDVEALTIKKFRGDLAYRRQEYQKALQEYSSISEKLPPTNAAMKRDVQEGQARSLAHLGRHAEALAIALNLEMKAMNTDHLTTALHLQLAVCASSRSQESAVLCLQKLISLHPFNPWNWRRLAEAYLALGPARSASCAPSHRRGRGSSRDRAVRPSCPHSGEDCPLGSPETPPESSALPVDTSLSRSGQEEEGALGHSRDSVAEKTDKKTDAAPPEAQGKACASFLRTRLLLQLTQSQQMSFALERNLRTQQEIEDKVKGFGFREDTLQLIAAVMGEDIVPEKIKDEVQSEVKCVGPTALSALVIASSKEFEDKWFGKIKDHI